MSFKISLLAVLIFIMVSCSGRKELSQWRGPDRDGKYPQTGLLNQWPDDGPRMLWSFEGLGAGHGSVSIAEDQLFVLGMPDTIGVIYSFDIEGNLLWQKEYGLEWYANYTGSRSTPTIADGLLYFVSGQGVAFCMDTETGEVFWSVDMFERFGAQETTWGIAESPLLDGDRIILTPGGKEHNVVALNRFTGETLWTSKGNGEPSAYCSPILVQHNNTRLIVTMTAESVIGIDADNGHTLWRIEHRQKHNIQANSPVYNNGRVFCANAEADTTVDGHIMIRLSEDGKTAEVGWRNNKWFNLLGGIILHEGCIYSSTFNKKKWYCIDAETGNLNYVSDQVSGGAIIFAEGLFYCYGTDGVMALVEADETDCTVISSFEVHLGTGQHWAHPVINDKRMYVRHGDALMCYDIAAE
ncbi:MAG: PQQ-binding-like beta-propeller repeat protein [Bacteroidetes bacterium]|nr:PQQ-binding-like beta-propeller repeat protein [Bacteroidota bacterium]